MEDLITKIVLTSITILCFGLISWLFKRWFNAENEKSNLKIDMLIKKQDQMNGSVNDMIERHHACREELPKVYATKDTVSKIFDKLEPIHLDVRLIKKQIAAKEKILAQKRRKND